jgi:hypothetical protein
MSKPLLEKIESDEKSRLQDVLDRFVKGKTIDIFDILGNETTAKDIINGSPRLWAESFPEASSSLPMNSLLYSKILVTACPDCTCSKQPELLKPYLERGIVIPVLSEPLTEYKEDFANMVLQYPYVGNQASMLLKYVRIKSSHEEGGICTNCYQKKCSSIMSTLTNMTEKSAELSRVNTLCALSFSWLYPAKKPETKLLKEIEKNISSKNYRNLVPIANKAWTLTNLRKAESFNAVPQVNYDDIKNIHLALQSEYSLRTVDSFDDKRLALMSLSLDFREGMNLEEYLDIVLPRKKRINNLLDELVISKGKARSNLSQIQSDIMKINSEINNSKKLETLTWGTQLLFNNSQVVASIIAGALIGYTSGNYVGCGIGGVGGAGLGEFSQYISGKYTKFKVGKYPPKTTEWLKSKLESAEEKALAAILAKDIKAIQVWSLRKKLEK